MANSQDIEARLCAYIDGDLDAEMRTEIERHLDAHPQHRRMIRDLMQTRKLVCALPRFAAPADLGEGLQGQLERSMLLGGKEDAHDAWRTRIRRVPQLAALAAVLALAVGLAAVLYVLLREANIPTQITAINLPPEPSAAPQTVAATQPALIAADAAPATQPAEIALAPVAAPTTEPAAADVAMDGDNDLPDDDFDMTEAPATQPSEAAVAAAATVAATPAATQPATQPVADDAGDK